MVKSNVNSIRVSSSQILYCIQCLYQNSLISAETKTALAQSLQACLSEDNSQNRHILYNQFYNIYEELDKDNFFRQSVWKVMDMIE